MCGKQFDFWDEQQNFDFDRSVGYGSKYDMRDIRLRLCCGCFDKLMDYIRPRCAVDPVRDEVADRLPAGGASGTEEESLLAMIRNLPETQGLRYAFRQMWLHEWQGWYVVSGMGRCTDPVVRIPYGFHREYTYGDKKQTIFLRVGEIRNGAFCRERGLRGIVLTGIEEIGDEAFAHCKALEWVYLSKELHKIGRAAFRDCENLKKIFYEGSEVEFSRISVKTDEKTVVSHDHGFSFEEYDLHFAGNEAFLNAEVRYNCPPGELFRDKSAAATVPAIRRNNGAEKSDGKGGDKKAEETKE